MDRAENYNIKERARGKEGEKGTRETAGNQQAERIFLCVWDE